MTFLYNINIKKYITLTLKIINIKINTLFIRQIMGGGTDTWISESNIKFLKDKGVRGQIIRKNHGFHERNITKDTSP